MVIGIQKRLPAQTRSALIPSDGDNQPTGWDTLVIGDRQYDAAKHA
jgi:hypothetical protein